MGNWAVFLNEEVLDVLENKKQELEKRDTLKQYTLNSENVESLCKAFSAVVQSKKNDFMDITMEMSAFLNRAVADKEIMGSLIKNIKYSIVLEGDGVSKEIENPEKAELIIKSLEEQIKKNKILNIAIAIESPISGYKIGWSEVLSPERSIFGAEPENKSLLALAWSKTTKPITTERDLLNNATIGWSVDAERKMIAEINKKILRVINIQSSKEEVKKTGIKL